MLSSIRSEWLQHNVQFLYDAEDQKIDITLFLRLFFQTIDVDTGCMPLGFISLFQFTLLLASHTKYIQFFKFFTSDFMTLHH